jgi:hypothetical protein
MEQRKSNEMLGAEMGYRYDGSPLIASEPGEPPPIDFMEYRPTTWPGARLPHAWLADGNAMQDRIGNDLTYALLRLGRSLVDVSGLVQAFAALGAPLHVLDIPDDEPRAIYGHDLLLIRPDLHVAWRGNQPPEDPRALAAKATGH